MKTSSTLTRALLVAALLAIVFGAGFASRHLAIDAPSTALALPMLAPTLVAPVTLLVLDR